MPKNGRSESSTPLVKTNRLAHGGLDMQGLDILPVLLEQRNEEIDTQHDVCKHLVLRHLNMADGNSQTKDFLQLELDGRSHLGQFVGEVLRVGDGSGEFFRPWRDRGLGDGESA